MRNEDPYASYVPFIEELAKASGALITDFWNKGNFSVESKADTSPVTEADRATEQLIRQSIQAKYPHHGIIGEEFESVNENAEFVWIIDPIDGTKSFITHVPLFVTLIGLLHRGQPVAGAIHQPITQELCLGTCTQTQFNGKTVNLRPCSRIENATVLTSSFEYLIGNEKTKGWEQLVAATAFSRTWGDGYGYLLLASGNADIMVDPIVNPWDILPVIPVIKGAGGKITTWEGNPMANGSSAVAAHPAIHPEVIELLRTQEAT